MLLGRHFEIHMIFELIIANCHYLLINLIAIAQAVVRNRATSPALLLCEENQVLGI